jgi:hypothetical protein
MNFAQIALVQMGIILFVVAIKYATLFLDTLIK